MKIKMLGICALIYSTNFILYLLIASGFIAQSHKLTSAYLNFTAIIAMLVCGWMNESLNHKKLDLYFVKRFPLLCLYLLLLAIVFRYSFYFPLLIFISMAAGARAYRWYAGDRKLFN
jgi:hypothetical protein